MAYCFCTSVGTDDARIPCDLFLTPIDHGNLVEIHSDTGRQLLQKADTGNAGEKELAAAQRWRQKKAERITAKFNASLQRIADILETGGLTPIWKETAQRCYSCGQGGD